MRTNNFKRLMEMEEERTPAPPPQIKESVSGTMGVFKFVGQIVEMYLPKVVDMLVSMMGGNPGNPTTPPDRTPLEERPEPPSGPGQ